MSGVLSNDAYKNFFGHPDSNAQGAIVASMPAGSFVGALAVSKLADLIGRKWTIIIAGWIWVVGSILQCAAQNRGMLVVGRIISGISVGIASAIVPLYQSEITEPRIRGRLVSFQQWSITWGILIQYFIQFGCSYIEGVASFRIPWGLQMIPAIVLSVGMLFFPESPRWLVDHDREAEALEILADLHGNGDANNSDYGNERHETLSYLSDIACTYSFNAEKSLHCSIMSSTSLLPTHQPSRQSQITKLTRESRSTSFGSHIDRSSIPSRLPPPQDKFRDVVRPILAFLAAPFAVLSCRRSRNRS